MTILDVINENFDKSPIGDLGHAARPLWMFEEGVTYLNHAGFGALSKPVYDAVTQARLYIESQPSRFLKDELEHSLRSSATKLGKFVGARGEDLVFVDNATTAVNAVLRSLVLLPGDEVVTTSHVYGAVLRTLEFICERAGARLIFADIPYPLYDAADVLESVTSALSRRTRLVVVDHITSKSALRLPVEEIASECADRNIPVLVDGAHAVGMIDLNISRLGVNWYAGNCHKWLGAPRGCGFLWTREEDQRLLRPTTISHYIGDGYTAAFDWPGTKDFSAYVAVGAAIDFRARFEENTIANHCHSTIWQGINLLKDAWGTELGTTKALTTYMGSVGYPGNIKGGQPAAEKLRIALREDHQIEVEIKAINNKIWLRTSAYLYNELADFEKLAEAVLA